MPISMNCPSCGKTLSAPDAAAGKKAKCPACGTLMIVPTGVFEAEEIGVPSQEPAPNDYSVMDDILGPTPGQSAVQSPFDATTPGQEPARRPCPECGELIIAGAAKCRFCGAVFDPRLKGRVATGGYQTVPNYLVQAILVTLFCCLPFGIVAIVYAAQVNGRVQSGDVRGAKSASDSAKMWCWVSFGIGFVVFILYFILGIIGAMAGH